MGRRAFHVAAKVAETRRESLGRAFERRNAEIRHAKNVTSFTTSDFRRDLELLPRKVRGQARAAYRLFAANPQHPGLKFKKIPPFADIWSVRISADYRAIGKRGGDIIVWFFIGSHSDYDKMLTRI